LKKADHSFQRAAAAAGVDPAKVAIYGLRHTNIVRQILAAAPVRVIAVNHHTSVSRATELEKGREQFDTVST